MPDFPDLDWPLMAENISQQDLDLVIEFLSATPRLTNGEQVRAFEQEWSEWLGVKHSVFVNSGSSANLLTMLAVKELWGDGEVIVPALTWVSDIASVLQCGLTPVFVDIDPTTLGMESSDVRAKITDQTRAVFLTHILGYNALTDELLQLLRDRNIPLIEDVCESHGATFRGRRLGSFGRMSNFSFYYGHHMSTIEGGMVCTDDRDIWELALMARSHGMVREARTPAVKQRFLSDYPDLNPDFIFALPAYNMRSTEINAVIGRSQLKRLDSNNDIRSRNLLDFLSRLDPAVYRTDFKTDGNSNYAFTLILREPNDALRDAIEAAMREMNVEFRRGTSGGGNQLRQPYLRRILGDNAHKSVPNVDHVHFYGYYIGNYPTLDVSKISRLCDRLNSIARPYSTVGTVAAKVSKELS